MIICDFLKHNTAIKHLDLSLNKFNLKECFQISNALSFNKTILGFHFVGNIGIVDFNGFL